MYSFASNLALSTIILGNPDRSSDASCIARPIHQIAIAAEQNEPDEAQLNESGRQFQKLLAIQIRCGGTDDIFQRLDLTFRAMS
jgi:hypothetical protein